MPVGGPCTYCIASVPDKISRTFDRHLFEYGYWHHHYHVASEGSQLRQAKEVGELTAAEVKRAEERREQVRKELEEKRKALDARWRAYEGLEGGTFDGGKVC